MLHHYASFTITTVGNTILSRGRWFWLSTIPLPKYWIRHRSDSGHDILLLLRLNYARANETTANWMRRWWLASGDCFSRHVGSITCLYVIFRRRRLRLMHANEWHRCVPVTDWPTNSSSLATCVFLHCCVLLLHSYRLVLCLLSPTINSR